MRIYYDILFIFNFTFDFLLLVSVAYILKRNTNLKRIFLGALVGSLSTFLIFITISNVMLFFIKFFLAVGMILVSFSYKGIRYFINNLIYLYLCSIVLGGGLYLIDNEIKLNFVVIILIGPLILYLYVSQTKKLKNNYNNYYKVEMIYNNKIYNFTAFLDTGNKLKDQYKNRPIILVNTDKIKIGYENSILVPYTTVNGSGILKCLVVDKIIVDSKKIIEKPLIGFSKDSFNIDGIDMILNNETL